MTRKLGPTARSDAGCSDETFPRGGAPNSQVVGTPNDPDEARGRFRASGLARQAGAEKARYWWTERTEAEPSPTAEATRFMDPERTSPTAKSPGRLVSNGSGDRSSASRAVTNLLIHATCLAGMSHGSTRRRAASSRGPVTTSGAQPRASHIAATSLVTDEKSGCSAITSPPFPNL